MDYQNSYAGMLDQYGSKLVAVKARQMVGKAGFTEADRQDIEQELALDLFLRMRHYDPSKSKRSTFMTRVVERHIGRLIEARQASKRDWRMCTLSLNEPLESSDLPEQIDILIDPTTLLAPERTNLRLDVCRALNSLPPELQVLGELLLKGSMTEAAREMDLSRSTLYGRMDRLRGEMRQAGLAEYL